MHRLQELVRLHRMGQPTRQIARDLGMGPNTERRYRQILADAGLLVGDVAVLPELEELRAAVEAALPETAPPQETSTVEEWRADIVRLLGAGAKPRSIYDWLKRERPKFAGTYPAVKRLCRRLSVAQGPRERTWRSPSTRRLARLRWTSGISARCTTRARDASARRGSSCW